MKKITFASGHYINLYGNGDVFIILNEANSEPTHEEYCMIEQEIRSIMQTDEVLTPKVLEKRIDEKLTVLEDQLECLQFGYQLRVEKTPQWSAKIKTYYKDLQELNITADEYNNVISYIYDKTSSEMMTLAKIFRENKTFKVAVKAFESVLNMRLAELQEVSAFYYKKINDTTTSLGDLDAITNLKESDKVASHVEDGKRKVLFTAGMSNDKMIIVTDAPKEEIEKWCRRYNEAMENGTFGTEILPFDTLKTQYYVKEILDSEVDDIEDVDIIGYDESYDLFDYYVIE